MGNVYYHDAYYGIEGAGELIVPLIPYIIAAQMLWAVWDWFNGGSLLKNIKSILMGWLKIVACLAAFVAVMLVIILVVANIQYVIPLFFLSVIVAHYWFDKKPHKIQQLSNISKRKETAPLFTTVPPPLNNDWVYAGFYFSNAPINEFLINHLSIYAKGDLYHVYYKHDHAGDFISQYKDSSIFTAYFQYDIIPQSDSVAHIICKGSITNKGSFAYYPLSIELIYKNDASEKRMCNKSEILGNESAVEDIFNRTSPHENCRWDKITGTLNIS